MTRFLLLLLMTSACATTPISEQISGKDEVEALQILRSSCEDESWRGHDSGSHHHYRHKPENKVHTANIVALCQRMEAEPKNRPALAEQCRAEARNGTYANHYLFNEHVTALTEICTNFGNLKGKI